MPSKAKNRSVDPAAEEKKESAPRDDEVLYTVDEFAANSHEVFGTGPDLVRAAFFCAGMKKATKQQALKLVQEFRKK